MSSVSDNLFGAYTHKLDPKNRIAIPAEWRPSEGCALLLLSGRRLDLPTVKAYTREKFQQLIDKIETTPGYTEAQVHHGQKGSHQKGCSQGQGSCC